MPKIFDNIDKELLSALRNSLALSQRSDFRVGHFNFTEMNSTAIRIGESNVSNREQLFLCAIAKSFTLDWYLRRSVAAMLNMSYRYQLPVPRLKESDPAVAPIVSRVARLTCTTPDFDALAKEVGIKPHQALDAAESARQCAKLDGLVAHLYGLTEKEFAHILDTFPMVDEATKNAAHSAYTDVERGLIA